jgi:hypothetical protein
VLATTWTTTPSPHEPPRANRVPLVVARRAIRHSVRRVSRSRLIARSRITRSPRPGAHRVAGEQTALARLLLMIAAPTWLASPFDPWMGLEVSCA